MLLPADFTAVISVSGITVVGVRCDRAECTKPWRALVCLVREWSQTPWVEANWNSFLTSSYSSSGCAVQRKENEVRTLAPSVLTLAAVISRQELVPGSIMLRKAATLLYTYVLK